MLTLNETIKLITDVADGHSQIAARGTGDLAEWNPSERTYPLLWVIPVDSDTEEARLNRTFRLGCFDRVITGEEGQDNSGHEQEVLSDMEMVLLDFVAYFVQQDQQDFFTARIANLTPATEQMDDRLAGYFVDLTISQDWTFNKCQIPATIGSIDPSVDGLTLYDFCDASVLARLTAAQNTCLSTAFGACADATVVNSATPTWSQDIVSGASYTLPKIKMLDSDGITTSLANYIPETDGFAFTATPCTVAPTITIALYSDSGHTTALVNPRYNQTIYVKSTVTGITPTLYTFSAKNSARGLCISESASNTASWVINLADVLTISVLATDGVSEITATATTTIDGFITKWRTWNNGSSNDDQIVIPAKSAGTYNGTMHWGDGTSDTITTWNDAAWTHTYAIEGDYYPTFIGTFSGWQNFGSSDPDKLLDIIQWGGMGFGNYTYVFWNSNDLEVISAIDAPVLGSNSNVLSSSEKVSKISVVGWDFSSQTNLNNFFAGNLNLVEITGLGDIDTSSVTIISSMLQNVSCNPDIQSWDVTSLTTATNFMSGSDGMSRVKYDDTLIAWAAQAVNSGVSIHFGGSKYTLGGAAEAARTTLTTTHGWTIVDGGGV